MCIDKKGINGFTLVELLIVIAVMLILAVAGAGVFANLQKTTQITDGADAIAQIFKLAKARAGAQFNGSGHGVYVRDRYYILYQGSSYASRDSGYDRVESLAASLSLTTSIVGRDINFSKGLGVPSATGTVRLIHNGNIERLITINDFGTINVE